MAMAVEKSINFWIPNITSNKKSGVLSALILLSFSFIPPSLPDSLILPLPTSPSLCPLVHQAHLLRACYSWPCIYLHSNRPLISSSRGACVEMVIIERAWKERSPGPLLKASRLCSMALIHSLKVGACVLVSVLSFFFRRL